MQINQSVKYAIYFLQASMCLFIGRGLWSMYHTSQVVEQQYTVLAELANQLKSEGTEFLDILDVYETPFKSRRVSNKKAAPYLELLEHYDPSNIACFEDDVDLVFSSITNYYKHNPHKKYNEHLHLIKQYPRLFSYFKAYCYAEAATKSGSTSHTSGILSKSGEPLLIKDGPLLKIYPNRLSKNVIFSKLRVNGKESPGEYKWTPTYAGTHIFIVEYKHYNRSITKVNRRFEIEVQ